MDSDFHNRNKLNCFPYMQYMVARYYLCYNHVISINYSYS